MKHTYIFLVLFPFMYTMTSIVSFGRLDDDEKRSLKEKSRMNRRTFDTFCSFSVLEGYIVRGVSLS